MTTLYEERLEGSFDGGATWGPISDPDFALVICAWRVTDYDLGCGDSHQARAFSRDEIEAVYAALTRGETVRSPMQPDTHWRSRRSQLILPLDQVAAA